MILCIETATTVCSVALCDTDNVLFLREAHEGQSHASQLTVLIKELLAEASVNPVSLDAVAVSKGPGSYTGLRIGVSVAKGIAYAAGIPLIGINTLESMCQGFLSEHKVQEDRNILFCPMLDARRMEVYNALFSRDLKLIRETSAEIIDKESFSRELAHNKIWFFGNGADKCTGVIDNTNALFVKGFQLSASYLHIPSVNALRERKFEDTAYFEPYYLKEFIATKPKNLIL